MKFTYSLITGFLSCLILLSFSGCRPDAIDDSNPAHSYVVEETTSSSYNPEINDDNDTAHQAPSDGNESPESTPEPQTLTRECELPAEADYYSVETEETEETESEETSSSDEIMLPMSEADRNVALEMIDDFVEKNFQKSYFVMEEEDIDGFNFYVKIGYLESADSIETVHMMGFTLHLEADRVWSFSTIVNEGSASSDKFDIGISNGTVTVTPKNDDEVLETSTIIGK